MGRVVLSSLDDQDSAVDGFLLLQLASIADRLLEGERHVAIRSDCVTSVARFDDKSNPF